jgi:hypothetical protein
MGKNNVIYPGRFNFSKGWQILWAFPAGTKILSVHDHDGMLYIFTDKTVHCWEKKEIFGNRRPSMFRRFVRYVFLKLGYRNQLEQEGLVKSDLNETHSNKLDINNDIRI